MHPTCTELRDCTCRFTVREVSFCPNINRCQLPKTNPHDALRRAYRVIALYTKVQTLGVSPEFGTKFQNAVPLIPHFWRPPNFCETLRILYSQVLKTSSIQSVVSIGHWLLTDRRTDTRTWHIPRQLTALRGQMGHVSLTWSLSSCGWLMAYCSPVFQTTSAFLFFE